MLRESYLPPYFYVRKAILLSMVALIEGGEFQTVKQASDYLYQQGIPNQGKPKHTYATLAALLAEHCPLLDLNDEQSLRSFMHLCSKH